MKRTLWIAGALSWLAGVGIGINALLRYETAPQQRAEPPRVWPVESRIPRPGERATLVMLLHPRCPCSRASVGEWERLMAQCQGRVSAFVLLVQPSDPTANGEQTDLRRIAAAIPGVQVMTDEGGMEAARFRAFTSGQTILYGANGTLLFAGGITAARGHAGDNAGRDAIAALVNRGVAGRNETPVFGCALGIRRIANERSLREMHDIANRTAQLEATNQNIEGIVQVSREYSDVAPITVEKHKVLQILVNLIRNAKYACDESGRRDKKLTVRLTNGDGRVRISVIDNGVGIPSENLIRIFNHGFTTRKDGHGFGLHSSALAAKELGGALAAHSDGPGQGATFMLELPRQSPGRNS